MSLNRTNGIDVTTILFIKKNWPVGWEALYGFLSFWLDFYRFGFLVKLSQDNLSAELVKLGWKQTAYKKKEFSKIYVDNEGNLKDFNAVADEVEQLTVEA